MKKIIAIIALALLLIYAVQVRAASIESCPSGSYIVDRGEDGAVICKLEPTGCPYGDSVPLGPVCDKLKPETPAQAPEMPETEPAELFVGK